MGRPGIVIFHVIQGYMNKLYGFIFLFVVAGCVNSTILVKDLVIKNSFFYKDSIELYSGHAFTKFENGRISNDILIKDGIPSGEWIAYGYQGEIVQKGSYRPVIFNYIRIEDLKRIQRINICEVEEGSERFIDIFIVSGDFKESVDKTGDRKVRDALVKVLRTQNIILEPSKINNIIGVDIELEQ